MKSLTLLVCVLVISLSEGYSQSLSLKYHDEVVSNDSVYLSGDLTDDLIELHLVVKNLTDKEIEVKVKKTEIFLVENTVNTFCWGSCFMPTVYVSPVSRIIPAFGSDVIGFAGDFEPSGMEGTSIIRYTFFNAQNEEDSVSVTSFFQVGSSGISGFYINDMTVSVYPNPVVDRVNILFSREPESQYSIRLLGLNGQVIKELVSESMAIEHSFDLSYLQAGFAILEVTNSSASSLHKRILIGR